MVVRVSSNDMIKTMDILWRIDSILLADDCRELSIQNIFTQEQN